MSPQSRTRKKKAAPSKPEPQGYTGFHKSVLRDLAELGTDPDPFELEVLLSDVLGALWDLPDADELGEDLVAYAGRKVGPASGLLLAGLAQLAPTSALRDSAARALRGLVARGLPEPEAAASLGAVQVGDCVAVTDVYGEQSSLHCVFAYGERRHGMVALVDHSVPGGLVTDVFFVENTDEVLDEQREQVADMPGSLVLEQVSPARANRLVTEGMSNSELLEDPPVTEDYVAFRALALARCRALPGPEHAPPAPEAPDREAVTAEFLRESTDVAGTEAVRECVRLLVDFGVRLEPHRPLAVSPAKVARFLEDWLPTHGEMSTEVEEALAEVLPAWVRWRAAQQGLPEAAVAELLDAVDDCLEGGGDLDSYLVDVPDDLSPDAVAELLDRRMFAVPSVVTELGEETLAFDPNDADELALLVVGEHPELHDVLDDDSEDAEEVREFLALKVAVVDQLWRDEPAETWEAASFLRAQGQERDEVLAALVEVLMGQLLLTTGDELKFDPDRYVEALREVTARE